jgi:type II secretory pathway pseudopilin PulG
MTVAANRIAPSRTACPRRAFTLVEMMVTIGVVIFLVAITVSATVALARRSEVHQTENVLRLLDMAMQEWETTADRKLTQGSLPSDDLDEDTEFVFIISEIFDRIGPNPSVKSIVAQINPKFVYTYRQSDLSDPPAWIRSYEEQFQLQAFVGSMTVLDAWGFPIYSTHPGRLYDEGPPFYDAPPTVTRDADGTIRTPNEDVFGTAKNRRICFVSAGPDSMFGRMDSPVDGELYDQTLDNVFSYPIDRPE